MRRIVLLALILSSFILASCGGPTDTTVGVPPNSTEVKTQTTQNAKVDKIIASWKQVVPSAMQSSPNNIKLPIDQKIYTSTAKLDDIATFYDQLTTKGWTKATNVPGLHSDVGILITGYEIGGKTDLVVGAVDLKATNLDKSGVVIYTAEGSK